MRRLVDLPGMAELERTALMKSDYADLDARTRYPEIDEISVALFGMTADEADDVQRPEGWDRIERKPIRDQVIAFEAAGWDVTDNRRPMRMLEHFNVQLWLAIRGVAGTLPAGPVVDEEEKTSSAWGASLAADMKKFKRDNR